MFTDHPRSRGVYADGLLISVYVLRIIPARAGFTGGRRRSGSGTWDHPRSRGVYGILPALSRTEYGSSPLARGLHPICQRDKIGVRIIPARAGFTERRPESAAHAQDHPRSRGVYINPGTWTGDMYGSSPLARGLPGISQVNRLHTGIIPARAGFTAQSGSRPAPRRDHPRSRGVYDWASDRVVPGKGSSPLARGLPSLLLLPARGEGIIPARAGFTEAIFTPRCNTGGSSPLARGLRVHRSVRNGRHRIIPARAGFTTVSTLTLMSMKDHPRSRGVYSPVIFGKPIKEGSSPLARGLLPSHIRETNQGRIIPARAGFTSRPGRRRSPARDHPRSRGVYGVVTCTPATEPGSSPLARGLRPGWGLPRPGHRIIPARAGFTHLS